MTTIVCVHNTTRYLAMHYLDLLRRLQERAQVVVIAPYDGGVRELERVGIRCIPIRLSRRGLNPIADIGYLVALVRQFNRLAPQIVFSFSIKPVIYGSLAARLSRVPRIFSMVTGLGYVFSSGGVVPVLLRRLVNGLYRPALKTNRRVFFQNGDDREIFLRAGLIRPEQACIVNGTGIDTRRFEFAERTVEPFVFVLIARMLRDKGIVEFCEAARQLRSDYPDTVFRLVGPIDDNPNGIPAADLGMLAQRCGVDYMGPVDDVRAALSEASVFVLPSYYREGTPRAILEAMACGLPIITTDHPGCRDTVEAGHNGLLVPTRDADSLYLAMHELRADPVRVRSMGRASREIAERRYDVHQVNDSILRAMDETV